jgi:adenylylsulfate kinase-like enzyme
MSYGMPPVLLQRDDHSDAERQSKAGSVIWITGLSGAGKTTLADATTRLLRSEDRSVVQLDGDDLRAVFGAADANAQNHGREGRLALALRYAHLCRILAQQGLTVVIATISLFREVHAWNRSNLPGYLEVYLKTPLQELRRRDPKGIYRRFDAGALANVAGLDLPVDEPEAADVVFEFVPGKPPAALADELIAVLMSRRSP